MHFVQRFPEAQKFVVTEFSFFSSSQSSENVRLLSVLLAVEISRRRYSLGAESDECGRVREPSIHDGSHR